jgi:hypothetical protein
LNDGTPAPTDEKTPWAQPGFVGAAVVVAVLVVLGLILAVIGGNEGSPATDAAKPAPPSASAPSRNPADSACGLPAGSQTVPSNTPRATKWELVGQIATPTASRTIGPGSVDGGLRSCFAHSPKGALYAAVNVIAMTADPKRRAAFIRKLTVPGVGRDRALADLGQTDDAQNAATALQVSGFKITDYRQESAVVDLLFRVDNGSQTGDVHLLQAMRWLDGDWKLALPDTGQPFDGMDQLTSPVGYVPWKGA